MYLSLPLQFATSRIMTVTVFSSDGTALPTVCTVSVPKHGRCRDLIQALTGSCSLNTGEKLLLAEVWMNLLFFFYEFYVLFVPKDVTYQSGKIISSSLDPRPLDSSLFGGSHDYVVNH